MTSPRGGKRDGGAPAALTRTGNRILRPGDFADLYVNPHPEFARMVGRGVLERLAHGYYLLVPEERRGRGWKPEIEAVALGIAIADYGRDAAALVGASAARALGALPRALGTATVAMTKQRPALRTTFGEVRFVTRNTQALDRQREETELVTGWITTPEQTALDLADRPTLGGITPTTAAEAIRDLAVRADLAIVRALALDQRKRGALQRLCWIAGVAAPEALRHGVPTRGLDNPDLHPAEYGLVESPA